MEICIYPPRLQVQTWGNRAPVTITRMKTEIKMPKTPPPEICYKEIYRYTCVCYYYFKDGGFGEENDDVCMLNLKIKQKS